MDDLSTSIIEGLRKDLIINGQKLKKNNDACTKLCALHGFEYLAQGGSSIVAARDNFAYKFYRQRFLNISKISQMQQAELTALKKVVGNNSFSQYSRHDAGWIEMRLINGLAANSYFTSDGLSFFKQKHWQELFVAVKKACELNIVLDPNYPNLLYDKDKGFTLIDFSDSAAHLGGNKTKRLLRQKDCARFITRLLICRNRQRALEEGLYCEVSDLL